MKLAFFGSWRTTMSEEWKLTKKEVADKALHLLKQLEFWQNLLEDWPADAEHIVLESPVDAKHIVLESKENADENN